jgi:hypothetical protein
MGMTTVKALMGNKNVTTYIHQLYNESFFSYPNCLSKQSGGKFDIHDIVYNHLCGWTLWKYSGDLLCSAVLQNANRHEYVHSKLGHR